MVKVVVNPATGQMTSIEVDPDKNVGTHNPLLVVKLENNSISGSISQRTSKLNIIVTAPKFTGTINDITSSGLNAIDISTLTIGLSDTACGVCGAVGYELVGGDTDYLSMDGNKLIL